VEKEAKMPTVTTNGAANSAVNYLNLNTSRESQYISQLASGQKIIKASDDSSNLAIGTQLQSQVNMLQQDTVNMVQGTSILQSTDGALAQISNVLQRMLSLATEGASGQVSNTQRVQDIGTEYHQLQVEIGSIINNTTYANRSLLSGSFLSNIKFMVGTTSTAYLSMTLNVASSTALLGTKGASVSTEALSLQAIYGVMSAISIITMDRALVGSYESQFNFSGQDIITNIQNTQAATSVIMDADVASAKTNLSAADVLTQASVAALTQAAQLPTELLRLLQS
jgi:flagellin